MAVARRNLQITIGQRSVERVLRGERSSDVRIAPNDSIRVITRSTAKKKSSLASGGSPHSNLTWKRIKGFPSLRPHPVEVMLDRRQICARLQRAVTIFSNHLLRRKFLSQGANSEWKIP